LFSEKLTRPSRQWVLLVSTMGLALAVSLVFAGEADAKKKNTRPFIKASTVAQSGALAAPTTAPVPLTGTVPYTFVGTKKIRSINEVTVQLTGSATIPGDTGLVLGLDGIDTGISLSSFGTTTATFTARGTPANAALIKSALKQDHQLVGTVIDRTPGDLNTLTIPATSNTTLQIKGKRNR
jgi:hypothetical protein